MTNLIPSDLISCEVYHCCQYFRDDNGIGNDCYEEQNGKAIYREEFGVFFCNHHYQKLSDPTWKNEYEKEGKDD